MAIYRPLFNRLLLGALLTVSLGQNLQAAELQPLSVANQKSSIKVLRGARLKTSDVNFIYLMPSESRLLLGSGDTDAWSTWNPYTTISVTQNQAKVLVSGSQLLTNHLYLAATSKAIADKRQQLDDFVVRVERAYRWTNEHPEEYAAAQAQVTSLPVAVHLSAAKNTRMTRVDIDDSVINRLQTTADIYQEEGILTKHIDVSKGFDKSLNAARALRTQASQ